MSRAIGYSVGLVVLIDGFRRGWKLAQVRTQLRDLEARLRAVDWSYVKRWLVEGVAQAAEEASLAPEEKTAALEEAEKTIESMNLEHQLRLAERYGLTHADTEWPDEDVIAKANRRRFLEWLVESHKRMGRSPHPAEARDG